MMNEGFFMLCLFVGFVFADLGGNLLTFRCADSMVCMIINNLRGGS